MATALLGTALLSGCSNRQEASTTLPAPSASAPTTAEALPPLGPPDLPMPAAARKQTPEGAEAFLRYYMEVYNHAQRTLDPTWMRDLSSGCGTCDRIADDMDADSAAGFTYQGGEVRVDAISLPAVSGDEAQIALVITQAPLAVMNEGMPIDGLTFPERSSPGSGAILVWDRAQSTWRVSQWDVQ